MHQVLRSVPPSPSDKSPTGDSSSQRWEPRFWWKDSPNKTPSGTHCGSPDLSFQAFPHHIVLPRYTDQEGSTDQDWLTPLLAGGLDQKGQMALCLPFILPSVGDHYPLLPPHPMLFCVPQDGSLTGSLGQINMKVTGRQTKPLHGQTAPCTFTGRSEPPAQSPVPSPSVPLRGSARRPTWRALQMAGAHWLCGLGEPSSFKPSLLH